MDHDKLFRVLVLGGTALTVGVGCSSSVDSASSPLASDAAKEAHADTTSPADDAPKSDDAASTDAPSETGDSVDPTSCDARCNWAGGVPFCDGVCCIWNSAHDCCASFVKEDGGG